MNGNTSRASALRSSLSVIDVDFPSQQNEQEGNLFANDDATDIDEDSDEAPQRHRRVQKRSVEDYSQYQQKAKRLRFLTADSPSLALTGPTSAFSSQSQQAPIHSGHHRPSENDSLLESYWVKAASKLGWPGLGMQKYAMTFQPAEIRVKVSYLLEDDRFTCHPSKQENCGFRFGALEIAKLLYQKWFRNVKRRGRTDKYFLGRINSVLICLTAACIYHALKAWSTGTFVQPSDFPALTAQNVYLRQRATWQRLPVVVQKKLVEDTKKRIKRLLRDNGFVPEHESRAALDDPDAAEYLWVQVSGDEESEVEDNNSDPEAEDVIDALVARPEEDE
ncbi:hypothetical protein HOY80DRAFT_1030152 [Tuber brumale]|nr:hypothetical protein HOY80DRAFT_1030152 [Tuber brumale]